MATKLNVTSRLFNQKDILDVEQELATKADLNNYATKEMLNAKVNINNNAYVSGAIQVYGKDQTDAQTLFTVAQGTAEPNTIVRRKANGAIVAKMSDDTTASEVATKSYVDSHSGGGTQLYDLGLNLGTTYDDIITIVGVGNNFFDLDRPNADALNVASSNIIKIIHKDKLVSYISSSGSGNYINVNDTLTVTYIDGTTATFTVEQIATMGGYIPL